jgi:diguanylate cyclase (GGDEF)-like protein
MADRSFAIDIQTMLVVMPVSAMLMASILWFAYAGRFRDGLARWTTSLWTQALAWLLLATHDALLPDIAAKVMASSLLVAAAALQLAAIAEFRRQRVARQLLWIAPVAALLPAVLTLEATASQGIAGDVLYGACNFLIVLAVLREPPHDARRARRLLALCYALATVALVVKAALAAEVGWVNIDNGPFYFGPYALIIAGSFAFLLMHKERADEESSRLATTDPLTGVFNRRTFIELAEQELARAHRAGTPLTIMMLDLDHFKQVNDTCGHLVGDEVLVSFTRLIRDCIRRGDLVVRYGGEEFCVLLPSTTLAAATALAERIRTTCAAEPLTERAFKVTVSIGLTARPSTGVTRLNDLLARADEALYRAKDGGRNQVVALPLEREYPATQQVLPLEQVG